MSVVDYVKEAGVIGCGGAGFPTHVKLSARADHFILNGVECEPLLGTDKFLMRHKASAIIRAMAASADAVGASQSTIALKSSYEREILALTSAIEESGADIHILCMENFYPAGDEQCVVYEVTGKAVPPGGIPLDVGAVVSNAATMYAVDNALLSRPFIKKYLTVAGEMPQPKVIRAPLGTPILECIRQVKATISDDHIVMVGGPIMGKIVDVFDEAAVVTKTTSGILLLRRNGPVALNSSLSWNRIKRRAASVCIQCNYCTQLCPRALLRHPLEPHKIMRRLAYAPSLEAILEEPVIRSALLCSGCGLCTLYSCPMGLQPREVNMEIKKRLGERKIRYDKHEVAEPLAEREWRKVPRTRLEARADVAHYSTPKDDFAEVAHHRVTLPLFQGLGSPGEPIVAVGEHVTAGQLIAICPERQLGSNLHASISGTVVGVKSSITIEGEAKT